MTKEELEKEAEELYEDWYAHKLGAISIIGVICKMAEPREKRITELEEKISVLLSCKNCPENKGGYICQKEYEDKCLAQKIEFIKELQKENAELKDDNKVMADNYSKMEQKFYDNLTKAKEIIKELMSFSVQLCDCRHTVDFEKTREEAVQFLKDSEVEK